LTQLAQVMPSTGRVTSIVEGGGSAGRACILPGSISAAERLPAPRARATATIGVGDTDPPMPDETGTVTIAAVASPWGAVHIAASSVGVVALENLAPRADFVARLERRFRREVVAAPGPVLDAAVAQVEEFLVGTRRVFDVPLDLRDRPAWDRTVFAAIQEIPWGETTSYGRVARQIDRAGAARAVGGAVGRCPVGLIVPCHRVIAGDGSLGGYGGDWFGSRLLHLQLKSELLAREGINIPVSRD
jgi:O-6-methylguanine DNA methyltransferase